MYLDDSLLAAGICSDLKEPEQKAAWLERVAHMCRAANLSGVSVVIETEYPPDENVRQIIGTGMLSLSDKEKET